MLAPRQTESILLIRIRLCHASISIMLNIYQYENLILEHKTPPAADLAMSTQKNSSPDYANEIETAEPALWRVLLLNDDYTPMDFVVYVLKQFFCHTETAAQKIMLDVHKKGAGLAGVYSFEIAETKSAQVNSFSKQNKYPLKCIIEEEME